MLTETVSLTTDLEQAYFQYAVETITDRALPRVEDGLKPVQRRILYAMHDMGLYHDRPHRKSARVVGEVLGKYHPHGDQSVYMAMVRMAQDFAMRQPLIDGQGNFGCFTGDTEVKLLDGTDRTFEELARRYGPDEVFYVYSVDNDGNIVVGEGRYSRVTRQNAKVIELELDNGEIIRCTPGHRFMLRDGSYKQAQDLTEDDSLMPGYFTTVPIREDLNDYLMVLSFPRFEKAMTYFDSFDEFLALSKTYNHRVVAKRVLAKRFDVYDITVEPYHNFLLSSGVFVHNSIDGDLPAAMRYTEARLDEVAELVLQGIDQDTVDFVDNFDGSLKEPVILPAALPNLLVNGAMGIAVGMATNIPPHNLGEVCDAVAHVASHWRKQDKITVDELMEIVPGPDFPTGGVIYRYRDDPTGDGKLDTIRAAYETGRGHIVTQARVDMEDIGGGKFNIVVTELPYAVQKSTVLERIAREVREGRISGVTDLRDESDHEGMRVVIEVSRMADAREVLEGVLSRSQLRETFGVNALALVAERVNGDTIVRPQRLSLHDMLVYFVEHRLNIIVRRSRYELAKREARLHIVQGLLKALDIIDEVIATIRRSRTSETAEANLIKQFGFTRVQAEAILAMQLRRLAALERRKLADEEKELKERIKYLKELLRSEARRLEVVVEETTTIKEKFATPRKTVILTEEKPGGTIVTEAELAVPDGPQVVVVTMQGVQRNDAKSFSYRVKPGMTSRAVEAHWMHLHTEPEDTVVLVSNRGRAWWGGVGRLPRSASFEELGLSKGEQVVGTGVLTSECCLVLGTHQGQVKRVKVEDVKSTAEASWAMVIGLGGEDDGVLFAGVGSDEAHVMFFGTSRANRFVASEVNPQATRSAKGVAGIKVGKGDRLLGGAVISDPTADLGVVVVSKNGYVKRVPLGEFPVQGRGGQGVLLLNQTKATGPVAAAMLGPMNGSVDLISADGKRQRLDEVPVTNRANRGERLVELEEVAEVVVL